MQNRYDERWRKLATLLDLIVGIEQLCSSGKSRLKISRECSRSSSSPSPSMSSSPATATAATAAADSRGSELRKDAVFDRWVIFSPSRAVRPSDISQSRSSSSSNPGGTPSCPFCIGREGECAPEIFRVLSGGGGAADWKVRVIENLYPALRRELEPQQGCDSLEEGRSKVRGFGFHDVVIETPHHGIQLSDLSVPDIRDVVLAYKSRVQQIANHGSIEYVQVFKNYGSSAGASMSHSHAQIIGLPLIPPTVSARLDSMKRHFEETSKCYLCVAASEQLLISESAHFLSMAPYAASFPFEVWIIPRNHAAYFHDLDDEMAMDFGGILKLVLRKLSQQLSNPPFNFMIHSSPLRHAAQDSEARSCHRHAHWFVQVVPQLSVAGGFELGTGCYINPVFPEDAAKVLREMKEPDDL